MKKIIKIILLILLLVLGFVITSSAHGGRTDSNGGHFDSSTGEYHYHHGYPAHSHNGGCPYDYDDDTSNNWGSSSGSSTIKIPSSNKDTEKKEGNILTTNKFLRILAFSFIFTISGISFLIYAVTKAGFEWLIDFIFKTHLSENEKSKEPSTIKLIAISIIISLIISSIYVLFIDPK